jgi:hypothetical protein
MIIKIKELTRRYSFSSLIIGALLVVALFFISGLEAVSGIERIDLSGISVDNSKNIQSRYINELQRSRLSNVQKYDIAFKGRALDAGYGNFFQTDDGSRAIRLELNKPNTISLIFFDNSEGIYILSEKFELNKWHDFRLIGLKNEYVKLYLDSKLVFDASNAGTKVYKDGIEISRPSNRWVTEIKGDFGSLGLGTGFSKNRDLVGNIENFSLQIDYIKKWNIFNISALFISFLAFAIQLLQVFDKSSLGVEKLPFREFLKGYSLLGLIFIAASLGYALANIGPTFQKWTPLVCIGLTILIAPWLSGRRIVEGQPLNRVIINLLYVVALFGLIFFVFKSTQASLPILNKFSLLLIVISVSCISVIGPLVLKEKSPIKKALCFVSLALLGFASWAALYEIPNWLALNSLLERFSPSTLAINFLILGLILRSAAGLSMVPPNLNIRTLWLQYLIPFVIFAVLSFRYDTLFLGSSEYHWEYFVGPIRSIRNGGWLLWDTPSQYGFLNILLATLVPVKSSWESLYLFQGMLLLIISCLVFTTLTKINPRNNLFNFLLVATGIFFADPDLIGPQLYPSSSVFRFAWCYVLIILIFNSAYSSSKSPMNMKLLMCAWVLGCLWSFESAVYSSAIYFSSLFISIFSSGPLSKEGVTQSFFSLCRHIFLSLLFLAFALGIIEICYLIKLGVGPDWRMYSEYALSYGSGFGGVPINFFGAVWVYILLFFGIYSAIYFAESSRAIRLNYLVVIAGSLGVILSLSTYLIGRAHGSNVTAVLPIICLVLVGVLKGRLPKRIPNLFLMAVSIPIFMVLFGGTLSQPGGLNTLSGLKSFTPHLENRLRLPDSELSTILLNANITPDDYVIYYGFHASMPQFSADAGAIDGYEKTMLPNPFQLLEEPIRPERRATIISRFMNRNVNSGYLIQAKGQFEERFSEWLDILKGSYDISMVGQNQSYRLYQLKKLQHN